MVLCKWDNDRKYKCNLCAVEYCDIRKEEFNSEDVINLITPSPQESYMSWSELSDSARKSLRPLSSFSVPVRINDKETKFRATELRQDENGNYYINIIEDV